jgi:MoxR-like ATPase
VKDIRSYIRQGPLGRVFSAESREVLLIDEIDKADLEFPNDILRELDEMQFTVLETGDEVIAKQRPMVIITSNNEKELPDAFLRRCVFHFIDFPDVEQMRQIVDVHHPQVEKRLLEQVLVKFYWLRDQKELRKRPSTSELIDWITALLRAGADPAQLESEIPFMGALLKNEQDTRAIRSFQDRGGKPPTTFEELDGKRR